MRVLVTGSSGRIGRAICTRLAREHAVVGLDRVPSLTTDVIGSIADVATVRRALQGIDAVVHTAALHAPHVGVASDAEFERVNHRTIKELGWSPRHGYDDVLSSLDAGSVEVVP